MTVARRSAQVLCCAPNKTFFTVWSQMQLEIFSRCIDGPKTVKRAHIGEGPGSLNSITTALYTIHRRQQCTGCSFQLLFPQIPTEISFGRTMHFFPFEKKKENQYLVSIHVEANQYYPQFSFSLQHVHPPVFSPSLANGK